MNKQRSANGLLRLGRLYAIASVVGILLAAIALAVLYRELSMRVILTFGERGNIAVATTALNAFRSELAEYLQREHTATSVSTAEEVPAGLLRTIRQSVRDTPIVRIKIYNHHGIVLYSTREYEVGTDDSANPEFQRALQGKIQSKLSYRDWFDLFERGDPDENLIETYVPVRRAGERRPIGVFEIYTDVSPIVRAMIHSELLVLLGIALIMSILYGGLLYVVRRSERIIADQQQTILERNGTLQLLSARMLAAEDAERRRIATELHEEIAHTLAAAKMRVEAYATAKSHPQSGQGQSETIVPLVQAAIRDLRNLAMDLRPPSLDDFGVLATARSLCREAADANEELSITTDFTVGEEEIPPDLKGIIFRILQETVRRVAQTPGISKLQVAIKKQRDQLELAVDLGEATARESTAAGAAEQRDDPIAAIWERAVLSGASFQRSRIRGNGVRYCAEWRV